MAHKLTAPTVDELTAVHKSGAVLTDENNLFRMAVRDSAERYIRDEVATWMRDGAVPPNYACAMFVLAIEIGMCIVANRVEASSVVEGTSE